MLEAIIGDHEYVAVLFTGLCGPSEEEEEECSIALQNLELIDSELDQYGIVFVRTVVGQMDMARQHWINRFPAIGYFRNGDFLKYKGEPSNSRSVFKWLTSPKATSLPSQVEEVNGSFLSKMISRKKSNVFVFFYERGDVFARYTQCPQHHTFRFHETRLRVM